MGALKEFCSRHFLGVIEGVEESPTLSFPLPHLAKDAYEMSEEILCLWVSKWGADG